MAQTKSEIQALLADAGTKGPRHRFGQNFMIDGNLVRLVAEAGEIQPGDTVVEVGPGTGTLSEELLARVGSEGRLGTVEIDRDLAEALRRRLGADKRFILIEGDALAGKHRLNPAMEQLISAGPAKLVANLPYNIASPLVVECLLAGVGLLAFTVQKEVADRLKASAAQEAYGPLSVVVQLLAEVELLRTLPPSAFWPMPKVDSALVRLRRRTIIHPDSRELGHFIHQLFSARRKTLRRALQQAGRDADRLLGQTGFDGRLRPEELTPPQFLDLWRAGEGNNA
jgi:16S rRNA (adenine1518-N6/adenine1519-N6)-dimethyltransferase